jgi:hypothetical protein
MTDYERDQEEVQAERRRQAQFPPYTTREQLLNQILALHDWYRDNPDEPMPRMIIASSTTRDEGTNDEPERVCAVVDFANQHEAEIHETWGEVTARLRLFTSPAMDIVIRRSTALDTTVGRYLR